jgi:hypothetical protein
MRRSWGFVAIAVLSANTAALADHDDSVLEVNRLHVPPEQWLAPEQIAEKLAAKGYKVQKIESEDGAYEVEMTTKDGMRIETHVHPATGELLPAYGD